LLRARFREKSQRGGTIMRGQYLVCFSLKLHKTAAFRRLFGRRAAGASGVEIGNLFSIDCTIDRKMHGYDECICIPSIGMSFAKSPSAKSRSKDRSLMPPLAR
jgi:hypothetical protein